MAEHLVDDTWAYVHGWKLFVIVTCLYFGAFLIALDSNIINVAIPKISADFGALDEVAWYGTAYLHMITALQPVYGMIYKHFPPSAVYKVSILVLESEFSLHIHTTQILY